MPRIRDLILLLSCGGGVIRIISARKATKQEGSHYQQ